jgi:hypothetical protein
VPGLIAGKSQHNGMGLEGLHVHSTQHRNIKKKKKKKKKT